MNGKRKGSAGERELAGILRSHGYASSRNDQRFVGGLENPDVSLPGVHVECKRCESLRLYDALSQAIHDANGKAKPVVMHRKNHGKWIVIMHLEDWIELYSEWEAGQSLGGGKET